MSFSFDDFTQILSSIDELLYMGESEPIINISIGYEDAACEQVFRKLSFSLKNGNAEVAIYTHYGIFSYTNMNGETLISIRFSDSIDSSYRKVLKQIISFDRHHANQLKINSIRDTIDVLKDQSELNNSSLDEIRKIIAEAA